MMMLRADPGQSYLRVATETASPGQLILMLYDGALRFLERARLGFKADDPLEFNQTIHNNVVRAQEILTELTLSLNIKQGGEFAATLQRLYDYMDRRLHESNRAKKEDGITEVIGRLTILRDAWAEMLSKAAEGSEKVEAGALSLVGGTMLFELYQEWLHLTQGEAQAIAARDWAKLVNYQAEKKAVADKISSSPDPLGENARLKEFVQQLIVLESENIRALAEVRQALAERQKTLAETRSNLQRIHRAYAVDRLGVWHSYS